MSKVQFYRTKWKPKLQEDINSPNLRQTGNWENIRRIVEDFEFYESEVLWDVEVCKKMRYKSKIENAYKLCRQQQQESTIHKIKNPKESVVETEIEEIQKCLERSEVFHAFGDECASQNNDRTKLIFVEEIKINSRPERWG